MKITGYGLFMDALEVEARIGIHDFERAAAQRLLIRIEVDIAPDALPQRDDIAGTFDYDWIRDEVRRLVASRHFDLQETLARGIVDILSSRREIVRVVVETAKPDVYEDVARVGCRLEARR